MSFAGGERAQIVDGRTCGKCSLCCKVMQVDEISKDPGIWCRDCAPGKGGCKIYETRPYGCRVFLCGWLVLENLGPEWFPAFAKLVVHGEAHRVSIWVDPASPGRWREEPYYSRIRRWALAASDCDQQLLVYIGKRVIAVLPDKEQDLGIVERDDHIMVGELNLPPGSPREWEAWVEKAENIPPEYRDKWIVK